MNALNPASFLKSEPAHRPQPAAPRTQEVEQASQRSSDDLDGVIAGIAVAVIAWAALSWLVPSPLPTILTLLGAGAFMIGESVADRVQPR